MIRQGDILLIQADAPTTHVTGGQNPVLGFGEVTGHKHVLQDAVWVVAPEDINAVHQFAMDGTGNKNPVFVLVPEQGGTLIHEEHAPLSVPPGLWQVVRQREYSPEAIRSVID